MRSCFFLTHGKYSKRRVPPSIFDENDTPTIVYHFSLLNTDVVASPVRGGALYHVVHTNLHSCLVNAGACTPFVKNTPGLSTHTPEKYTNLTATAGGSMSAEITTTDFSLAEGRYTVIAHVRWYATDGTKFDAAIGVRVQVEKSKELPNGIETSQESSLPIFAILSAILVVVALLVLLYVFQVRSTSEVEASYAHRREKMDEARNAEEGRMKNSTITFNIWFFDQHEGDSIASKRSSRAMRMIISSTADFATFLTKVERSVG